MFTISDALKATIRSKAQLWIGYFLLASVIVLGCIAAYNFTMRLKQDAKITTLQGKVDRAETRVQLVEEVNKQQAEALETIKGLNSVNDTMLSGLAADMEALRVRDRTTYTRLAALEKSNEAVRQYLNARVPDPVACLLDQSCPEQNTSGSSGTKRGAAGTVPAAAAGSKSNQR